MASADDPLTDSVLVSRARRGDATAFDHLVRRHYRYVYVIALSVLGRAADAEDACQDAFIRAAERLDQFQETGRFQSWIGMIVRNIARDHRDRSGRRATELLDDNAVAGETDIAREQERGELARVLEGALAHLSETRRQVVLLHDLEGWRHREIAEKLGMSEGMSRQHLFEARRVLRGLLRGYLTAEGMP